MNNLTAVSILTNPTPAQQCEIAGSLAAEGKARQSINGNCGALSETVRGGGQLISRPTCCGKFIYDKKGAMSFINSFQKRRGRNGRARHIRAYPCEKCNGWHLTKQHEDI